MSEFYGALSTEQKDGVESVSMDMWPAYIKATRDALTGGDSKIAFDRFHVAQYLGKAVDQVAYRFSPLVVTGELPTRSGEDPPFYSLAEMTLTIACGHTIDAFRFIVGEFS